jgi:hypothetical protein
MQRGGLSTQHRAVCACSMGVSAGSSAHRSSEAAQAHVSVAFAGVRVSASVQGGVLCLASTQSRLIEVATAHILVSISCSACRAHLVQSCRVPVGVQQVTDYAPSFLTSVCPSFCRFLLLP